MCYFLQLFIVQVEYPASGRKYGQVGKGEAETEHQATLQGPHSTDSRAFSRLLANLQVPS